VSRRALLLGVVLAQPLWASDWSEWLARAERAQTALNFDGVLIVDQGDDWRAYEVRQQVTQAGIEQTMTALNGPDRRLVKGPQGVSVLIGQGDQRLAVAPLGVSTRLLEPLAQAYDVSLVGRDRIAGREAQRLDLRPRSADRFGVRLWLDVETALPLRGDQFSADGRRIERRMLAKVNVQGFGRAVAAAPSVGATPLRNGFVTIAAALPVQGMSGARQWLLTDGVAYVSVFAVPGSLQTSNWRTGAMAQQRVSTSNGTLVVLGNAPDETLRALAEAIGEE
jgi:sigma-E factor negative regulatory protein RseB